MVQMCNVYGLMVQGIWCNCVWCNGVWLMIYCVTGKFTPSKDCINGLVQIILTAVLNLYFTYVNIVIEFNVLMCIFNFTLQDYLHAIENINK